LDLCVLAPEAEKAGEAICDDEFFLGCALQCSDRSLRWDKIRETTAVISARTGATCAMTASMGTNTGVTSTQTDETSVVTAAISATIFVKATTETPAAIGDTSAATNAT